MSFFPSIRPFTTFGSEVVGAFENTAKVEELLNTALAFLEVSDVDSAVRAIESADKFACPVRDLEHVRALCLWSQGKQAEALKAVFDELVEFPDNEPAVTLLEQMAVEMGVGDANGLASQWRKPELWTNSARRGRKTRIGMVTPWEVRCGIGNYAKEIVTNRQHDEIEYFVFARRDGELLGEDTPNVRRCWNDYLRGVDPLDELYHAILAADIDLVNVQFNYTFYHMPALMHLFERLQAKGVRVLVTFHSTEPSQVHNIPVSIELMAEKSGCIDRVLTYKKPDAERLRAVFGASKVLVSNLPITKFRRTPARMVEERRWKLGLNDCFVIATHGFILPNKGLEIVLEAIGILHRRGISNVKFLSVTSRYMRPELSDETLARCAQIASAYGVLDRMLLVDEYLERNRIHQLLELADVIAFCYTSTQETASAAIRQAVHTSVPIITTPRSIFDDIAHFSQRLEEVSADALANAIEAAMRSPQKGTPLLAARALYLNNNSTEVLVADLEREMLRSVEPRTEIKTARAMSDLPKISVVSPSYNCAKYIRRCIEGVLAQGYPNFEHIIVDGASTDGTVEILKQYPHVRWISEKDSGEAEALNKALRMANGEIISWLNVDDHYFDHEVLHHVAETWSANRDAGVIYGKGLVVNEAGEAVMYRCPVLPPVTVGTLMRWYTNLNLCQPAMFYSAEMVRDVGAFREDLYFSIDLEYWLRIAAKGYRWQYIDRILANATLARDGAKSGGSAEEQHKNWQEIVTVFQDCLTRPERINYWRDFYLYRIRNPLGYETSVSIPSREEELLGMTLALLELFDVGNAAAVLAQLSALHPPSADSCWLTAEIQHRLGQNNESCRTVEMGRKFQLRAGVESAAVPCKN